MRLSKQNRQLLCRGMFMGAVIGVSLTSAPRAEAIDAYFRKTQSDANVYVAPVDSAIKKVAVLPFKAPTELIGSSGSDIFVTEMLRTRRYTLVERSQMSGVLGETEMALSGLSESAAIEAGRMMGADGVILGTVDEYGTLAYRGRSYPVVGASIRLIDCTSGRVMWSVGHARKADSPAETLSGHARDVMHEMVSALVQNWDVQYQVDSEDLEDGYEYDEQTDEADEWVGYDARGDVPERLETPPPDAPEGFGISDLGIREATIQWETPDDRGQKIRIERAEASDGPFVPLTTIPGSKGIYTDKAGKRNQLQDATTYYYRLVAVAKDGKESDPTIALESMTAPPPEPPTDLMAEATAGRALSVEWSPPQCEGIVQYLVERALVADEVFTQVGTVKSASFSEGGTAASPLRDSTTYLYRVRAVNRVGAVSEASESVEVITLPPPEAPEGLMAMSLEVRCVPLEWDVHADEDVIRYEVYRSDSDVGPFDYIGSSEGLESSTYLDGRSDPGNLDDDTAYYYCVRAINVVTAESDDSEVVMAATRPVPPVVEGLAVVTGLPRRVEISWDESSDEKVIAYEVDRAEDEGEFQTITRVNGIDVTDYTDTGDEATRFMRSKVKTPLKDGTAYAYRIRALNTAEATSDWCDAEEAVTKVIPRTPTGLKISEGRARVIGLVWKANTEGDIAEYVVETAGQDGGPFAEAARVPSGGKLGFKQEGLPPALHRFYRVQAVDIDGLRGSWTDAEEGTTKPLPEAPTDLDVEWESDGAWVRWSPPPQDDIVQYRILNRRFMGQDELAISDEVEFFFPMDSLAKKKVMMVIAVDSDGLESPVSGILEVRKPR
jgi:uncharacterized protein